MNIPANDRGGTRTPNPLIKSQLLSQLSYAATTVRNGGGGIRTPSGCANGFTVRPGSPTPARPHVMFCFLNVRSILS